MRFHYLQEKFKANPQPPVSGLSGQWFDRESTITLRQLGRKMTVKELLAVVPAQKGFFALHYWAPEALSAKYLPVFRRVVQSFQALP